MVYPSVMTWVYFVAVAGPGTQPNQAVMIAYFVGKVIQFAFPAIYVALTQRRSLYPAWPSWQGLVVGLAFGGAVGGAALAIYFGVLKDSPYLRDTPDKVLAKLRESGYGTVAGFLAVAFFYSIVHSLLEEYYW